jgi:parallel beta-helix repeat protein
MKPAVTVLTVAIILLAHWATTNPSGQSLETGTSFAPHLPISIEGNAALTGTNGITGGSGTFADPFLIDGWGIDLSSSAAPYAITINSTDLPLIIKDVYLHSGGLSHSGIRLSNVENIRVENSTISNGATGVYVKGSTNIALLSNNVTANRFGGIVILSSSNITVVGNTVSRNSGAGVEVEFQSANVSLYHNIFIDNQVQAIDEAGSYWDNGYPSGGNKWSNYDAADLCSGPNQDDCGYPIPPNPDGIGDRPYTIDSNSIDRYPLMLGQVFRQSSLTWLENWYLVLPIAITAVVVAVLVRKFRNPQTASLGHL